MFTKANEAAANVHSVCKGDGKNYHIRVQKKPIGLIVSTSKDKAGKDELIGTLHFMKASGLLLVGGNKIKPDVIKDLNKFLKKGNCKFNLRSGADPDAVEPQASEYDKPESKDMAPPPKDEGFAPNSVEQKMLNELQLLFDKNQKLPHPLKKEAFDTVYNHFRPRPPETKKAAAALKKLKQMMAIQITAGHKREVIAQKQEELREEKEKQVRLEAAAKKIAADMAQTVAKLKPDIRALTLHIENFTGENAKDLQKQFAAVEKVSQGNHAYDIVDKARMKLNFINGRRAMLEKNQVDWKVEPMNAPLD
ncbi:MAG: hypothetical protein AAF393_15455 [Pseudomonadota bacterium]